MLSYNGALDAAEMLLAKSQHSKDSIRRYARTALEFAYALKMADDSEGIVALVAIVKVRLQSNAELTGLISPLIDVQHASKQDVNRWMNILFAIDEVEHQIIH